MFGGEGKHNKKEVTMYMSSRQKTIEGMPAEVAIKGQKLPSMDKNRHLCRQNLPSMRAEVAIKGQKSPSEGRGRNQRAEVAIKG